MDKFRRRRQMAELFTEQHRADRRIAPQRMSRLVAGMDVAGAEQEMRRVLQDAEASAARYKEMHRQVAAVTCAERSPDGQIQVTVDSNGVPTKLWIAERARDMPASRIAAAVLATMRAAQARMTQQVAQVMRDTVGSDTATADALLATYRERFPEPEAEFSRPAQARRPPVDDTEDEGWGERPIIT